MNDNLWKLLCTLHAPEQDMKRIALDEDTIEYYPKTIFYCEASNQGDILVGSQQVKQLSRTQTLAQLWEKP